MNATSLLLRCREGDSVALDEFVRRYQPVVERLALAVLDDGCARDPLEEVRAVVQETLVAAVAAGELFRDETDLSIWMYATGVKACQKRLRWRASLPQSDSPPANNPPGPQRIATHQAIAQLDQKLRLPLLLYYSSGLSLAEIAQVLKLSQSTIQARMVQGREKMRVQLEAG